MGTYGFMSFASLTSAHMFPAIFAAFFFKSARRSLRPLDNTGTISASDGASTTFTNVISSRTSKHGCRLNLRVSNHVADLLQRARRRVHDFRVRVDQRLGQTRDNLRETRAELFWRARGHRAQELHAAFFRAPGFVLQAFHQRRQHELHALRAELAHDRARGGNRRLAHVRALIPEAHQKHRKYVDDVRLEQTTESDVQELERHERALARVRVFLILHRGLDRVHHAHALQRADPDAFDRAGETERGASAVRVPLPGRDLRQQAFDQRPALVVFQ
eukprot:30936-Pelagococcus_subviridis.AAC.36